MSDQQLVNEDLKKLFNLMAEAGGEGKKWVGTWQQEIKKRLDNSHSEERESSELAKKVAAFDGATIDKMQRELASGGPPYWDVLASTDVQTLEAAFKEIGQGYRIPSKHHYSEVSGDDVLNECHDNQRHEAVATLLWKMEQLAETGNMREWKKFLDTMAKQPTSGISQKHSYLLVFDHIRIELEQWNKEMHRSDDSQERFNARADKLASQLKGALHCEREQKTGAFLKASIPLASFKLNRGEWNEFFSVLAEDECVKTPITEVARVLAVYLYCAKDQKNADKALKVANEACWPVLIPVFETRSDKQGKSIVKNQIVAIEPSELLDFLRMLKHRDVIDFLLSLVAYLHNSVAQRGRKLVQPTSSFSQPPPLADKHIHVPKLLQIWSKPEYDGSELNTKFLYSIFDALLANALRCDPLNLNWLRMAGDYHFARNNFGKAMLRYVEVMVAFDKGLIACDINRDDMDEIYSKMSCTLSQMEMPTLAAVVGQLRGDMLRHLPHVRSLLAATPDSVDAGCLYFPLIADKSLMEKMRSAYDELKMPVYHRRLVEEQARLAMMERIQSLSEVSVEKRRRVHRLKSLLINQFFDNECGGC